MKKQHLFLALTAVLALSGCKKLKPLTADDFKVTPTPLVVTAGEVPATISVTYPEKYMKKKAVITATPVLKFGKNEVEGNSVTYQGEKVEGNGTTVNYKIGGTYTMKSNFRYTDDMLRSDLCMRFQAKLKKKEVKFPELKIGYGILATSQLLGRCLDNANAAEAPDNFQRVIAHKKEASIKFLIAQSNLRTSELQQVSLKDLVAVLKEINDDQEGRALDMIEVSAYASPDGKYSFNEKLAERRQVTGADYLKKELKKIKMDADINTKYTAEDWDGFQELIAASNLQDKQVILSVLSMYKDPEEREQQIRNMSAIYTDIKDGILPELRRARLIVNYEVIGRSDEQIFEQFKADARQLSVEEMVYAATLLCETNGDKKVWNQKIMEIYPNDYRAYNNMAQIAYSEGDYTTAADYLKKAKNVSNSAPEVNTNLALLALREGDVEKAETLLAQGSGSNTYDEILGCLNIAKGNYGQASQNLKKAGNNVQALADLLSNDYESAAATLNGNKRVDANTHYLAAILAARQGDGNGMVDALKQAFEKDPSLKLRAQKDLEFARFATLVTNLTK